MFKKSLLKGLFALILLVFIFIIVLKLSKAETIIDIINVTMSINTTTIVLNISNNIFTINNTASVVNIQQNFTIYYVAIVNITNQTIISNVTCSNASISVSCSCPSCPSLPSIVNSSCSEVSLDNATKTEFYNHYVAQLGSKIEETSNKVAQDVIFKLEPSKVQLDDCRDKAINATTQKIEAERQRDTALSAYDAKLVEFDNTKKELNTLQVAFIAFMVIGVLGFIIYVGLIERKGNLYG